jgi:hypothetical protein
LLKGWPGLPTQLPVYPWKDLKNKRMTVVHQKILAAVKYDLYFAVILMKYDAKPEELTRKIFEKDYLENFGTEVEA